MASISTDSNGNRRILFSGPNRKRKIIYLGGVPMKTARTVKSHVENLAAAMLGGHAPDPETSEWVGSRDDVLYGKLAAVGLVPKREPEPGAAAEGMTLAAFIDQYITARMIQKPNTLQNYNGTKRALLDFFGQERLLAEITPGDCDDWRAHQVGQGLAPATIGRDVKRAKQFFRAAVRKKLIAENPMQDVKAAPQDEQEPGVLRHRGGDGEDHRGLSGCRMAADRGPGTLRRAADALGDVRLGVGLRRLGAGQGPRP